MDGLKLQKLLEMKENPNIVNLLEMLEAIETIQQLPKQDILVTAVEAGRILHVSKGTIYKYVKEGLIEPVYTPHSSTMKFWTSDVRQIPTKEVRA